MSGPGNIRTRRSAGRAARLAAAVAIIAACTGIVGCSTSGDGDGGGNGGPAAPTGIALTFGATRVQVTREVEIEATNTYGRVDPPECDWYVDGVLSGNSQKGTISQTNPATYAAPSAVPAGGEVVISAVSRSDTTLTVSDTLAVAFTIKYVDAANGVDAGAGGAWAAPFKTITHALGSISEGDTVFVYPGRYDEAHGEDYFFPLGNRVTLLGAHRDSVILATTAVSWIVELQNGSTIQSVTIEQEDLDTNHAIRTIAESGRVRDVRTVGAYGHSAIRIGALGSEIVVEDCEIVNDVVPGTERGFEIIGGTHSTVRGTVVSGWGYGIMVTQGSDPIIEGCTITDNNVGIITFCGPEDATLPDLGGGARGCLGGNVIQDNTQSGISNGCDTTIWAQNNTWNNAPPSEGGPYPTDIENTGGGGVIWF